MAREYCSCKSPYRSTNGGSFIIIVDVPTGARYRRIFHLVSSSLCPCPSGMSFYSSILLVVVFVYVDVTGFQRRNDIKRTHPRSGTTCRLVSPLPVIINRERVFQGPRYPLCEKRQIGRTASWLKRRTIFRRDLLDVGFGLKHLKVNCVLREK